MIVRALAVGGAFLSLFLVPWPIMAALILVAALLVPPAGVLLGIAADALYFVPGTAFLPFFTLLGLLATALALLVQRFVKTRIMEG